jgi:hypothetical protein
MTYYIVLERTWKYNDEYHYTTHDDSGLPSAVFADEAEAKAACFEMNREKLSGLHSQLWPESWFDYLDWGDDLSGYEGLVLGDLERYDAHAQFKKNLTEAEAKRVMEITGPDPYYFVYALGESGG